MVAGVSSPKGSYSIVLLFDAVGRECRALMKEPACNIFELLHYDSLHLAPAPTPRKAQPDCEELRHSLPIWSRAFLTKVAAPASEEIRPPRIVSVSEARPQDSSVGWKARIHPPDEIPDGISFPGTLTLRIGLDHGSGPELIEPDSQ